MRSHTKIYQWLLDNRAFEGLVGHIIAAISIPSVLVAAYAYFSGIYPADYKKVCIEKRGELLRDRDAHFSLLHVRNRLGDPGTGEPLWENNLPMEEEKGTSEMCASVRYVRRGGFQFKVYIKFDSINYDPNIVDKVEERLKEKVRNIAPDYPCLPGRPLEPKTPRPESSECVTYDLYTATIWILLREFPYVQDRHYWNNWWSSPFANP